MSAAPDAGAVAKLKAYIERHERLDEQIAELRADRNELRREMKDDGFVLKTIDQVLKRRALGPEAVIEADALLETYEQALGCGAAAGGILETSRGEDGVFRIALAPREAAEEKLSKATQARRAAMGLARAAAMAREN